MTKRAYSAGTDWDEPYDRKPDEDVEDEEVAEHRRWRRAWEDEHPFNQHDFL